MVELYVTTRIRDAALKAIKLLGADSSLRKRLSATLVDIPSNNETGATAEAAEQKTFDCISRKESGGVENSNAVYMDGKLGHNTRRTISHRLLKELADFLIDHTDDPVERTQYGVVELARRSAVYVEPPTPRVKSAQLLAILESIRVKQANEQYYAQESRQLNLGKELREGAQDVREGIKMAASVANVLFSVVGMGYGAYYVSAQLHQEPGIPVPKMSSFRDAVRRLQIIYDECVPKDEKNEGEKGVDEFTKLKKKVHQDVKTVRQQLKEREELLSLRGTSPETAESSYRIRVAIKAIKEDAAKMKEIANKDERKNKKDPAALQRITERKEIVDLVFKHLEECETLEKKRFNDKVSGERTALLTGGGVAGSRGGAEMRHRQGAGLGASAVDSAPNGPRSDPFLDSDLPDIDVGEDLKMIQANNALIDKELDQMQMGITVLKNIAEGMGQELEKQNEMLDTIEIKVDKANEKLDNLNVKMKNTLDKASSDRASLSSPTVITTSILECTGNEG
ncbi:hypothetical protein HDU93_007569 [Gonapodya sp. JEL0774]|nr:hypothetical protein HDU93_007569 [Gonapodya sp. JEL0774]